MLFSPLLDKDDLHLSKLLQPLFDNLVHVLKLFDLYRASRSLTKTGLCWSDSELFFRLGRSWVSLGRS